MISDSILEISVRAAKISGTVSTPVHFFTVVVEKIIILSLLNGTHFPLLNFMLVMLSTGGGARR